ncbi:MAG: efflux transporter periplasmic adaptor subunit [Sphingobacteriaceae bacterium]|jgi:RND family efflux transporter MFP subunit|nr:efflux transporter periplasmic adaptor subunit [Sphingobacteriaceae bacterium]
METLNKTLSTYNMKPLIYTALVLFLASCGSKTKNKTVRLAELKKQQSEINQEITKLESEPGKKGSSRVTEVSAFAVLPRTFTSYIQVQGTIDAEENVMANAEAPGIITAIYKRAGDQVSRGQVIAQLDNKALQQQILQIQSQVELATTVFNRQKNLWDQKIGTEVQYLQAKTNRDVALKQLAAVRAQASMYRIVAPINGTIDQMDLKIGQAVQPGMQGVRIVNLNKLKVKAAIPETYAGKVKQGDRVIVSVPDAKDSVNATVSYAAKVIDPSSRSFGIEVRLPSNRTLKPNMTAVLRIVDYQKSDAIVLPVKAIMKSESGEYVYVAENNVAKRVEISTGSTYGGQTEVTSGLTAGDKIITEGTQNIEDGDAIRVVNL